MKIKKILALAVALTSVFAVAGCGSTGDSSSKVSTVKKVKVEDTQEIEAIPDDAQKTIRWMGTYDLNPDEKKGEDKSVEMTLFNNKGGKVEYTRVTDSEKFDQLASAIMAQQNVPDIFKYEWMAFPAQVLKDMYQPVDDIVNFDDPLWADVKTAADKFVMGGKHYVAPISFTVGTLMMYDQDVIDAEGLDDPYELYVNNEWTWKNWEDIMSSYVGNAPADTERYGVNGFFRAHVVQQTGKRLVNYDHATNEISSNLNDPDIEKAQNFLYNMMKDGLILNGWVGSARDCFNQNCLFYAMGDWAYTGNQTPKEGENRGVDPIPQYDDNQQKITTSDMTAFMWVKGSTRSEAVKCWFECVRASKTDPKYEQTNKDKFMENNPNWTDEMYDVKMDVVSDDYLMLFDYAYGISSALGDRKQFDGNQCLVDALYSDASNVDEEGVQSTWTQVREKYSATVDSEIKELNQKIASLKS